MQTIQRSEPLFSCPEHLATAVQILDTREVPALTADGAEAKPPESYRYESPIIVLLNEENGRGAFRLNTGGDEAT